MQLITALARAYVYAGDWVADCPADCGNVEHLFDLSNRRDPSSPRTVRKATFHCSYCHHLADIEWSPCESEIMAVLEKRPIPHTRNWYPSGHEVALRFNLPHGQTIAELITENAENGVT